MKIATFSVQFVRSLAAATVLLAGCGADIGDGSEFDNVSEAEEAELGELSESLVSCTNLDGTNSVMAAMAVATAQELGRWQPKLDFVVGKSNGVSENTTGSTETIKLTAAGKARCADGKCAKLQALLDLQYDSANNKLKLPGNVVLNSPALRSRTVAKLREQLTCEAQPANGGSTNCPVETHQLTFLSAAPGACDTIFTFKATTPTGTALKYPAQLKNKLLWIDRTNPYLAFQSTGDTVSIDPTYGLNESTASTGGSCTAACAKITTTSVAGQCCSCSGATKTFVRAAWNANTYLCQ